MRDLFAMASVAAIIGAWLTSFIYGIQRSEWLLVLVDCLIWPVGIIHGFGLWFGWW